jgi:hypothetical protein
VVDDPYLIAFHKAIGVVVTAVRVLNDRVEYERCRRCREQQIGNRRCLRPNRELVGHAHRSKCDLRAASHFRRNISVRYCIEKVPRHVDKERSRNRQPEVGSKAGTDDLSRQVFYAFVASSRELAEQLDRFAGGCLASEDYWLGSALRGAPDKLDRHRSFKHQLHPKN